MDLKRKRNGLGKKNKDMLSLVLCFVLFFFLIVRESQNLENGNKYSNPNLSFLGSQASLQTGCNKEGFNAAGAKGASKARIGILGNNEKDCATTDSRIGFGTGGYRGDSNTCGNYAIKGHTSDNGAKNIKAMGYILVQ